MNRLLIFRSLEVGIEDWPLLTLSPWFEAILGFSLNIRSKTSSQVGFLSDSDKSRPQSQPYLNFLMALGDPSQIFFSRSCNSTPEDRAIDFHINLIEGTHDSLHPVLVDFGEELLDGLLRLRGGGIRSN